MRFTACMRGTCGIKGKGVGRFVLSAHIYTAEGGCKLTLSELE